jgi:phosphoribosylformylglycinamidine synthase
MSSTHFLSLRGSPALSTFRLEKLYANLKKLAPSIANIHAEFVHFVFSESALNDAQQSTLKQILTYGAANDTLVANIHAPSRASNLELFLVIPRIGTISPWASRATDIAKNCGLENILRIERGIAFYVEANGTLSSEENTALKTAIHDRMTEQVFTNLNDAEKLYHHAEPKPLSSVDILKGGKAALETANSEMGLALSVDEVDYLLLS